MKNYFLKSCHNNKTIIDQNKYIQPFIVQELLLFTTGIGLWMGSGYAVKPQSPNRCDSVRLGILRFCACGPDFFLAVAVQPQNRCPSLDMTEATNLNNYVLHIWYLTVTPYVTYQIYFNQLLVIDYYSPRPCSRLKNVPQQCRVISNLLQLLNKGYLKIGLSCFNLP